MSKIFERLIHDHLMDHCREAAVTTPEETGFQKGVSCDHHLVKLQAHTIERMKNNYATAFISLDCSQGFESVSHPLLLRRVEEFRFPAALCRLVENYLSNRSFVVRVGGDLSPPSPTTCGVPQGFGPLLFVVFTAPVVAINISMQW
nr:uncharacterized protein LOC106685412 [Halyomorpha halys]